MDRVGQLGGSARREVGGKLAIKVEGHQSELTELEGVEVRVTSYQIGERYFCHVTNVDPGATIARGEGDTRDEAREVALSKATRRL